MQKLHLDGSHISLARFVELALTMAASRAEGPAVQPAQRGRC